MTTNDQLLSAELLDGPVVATDELRAATGAAAWVDAMVAAEGALARAEAKVGVIPAAAAAAIDEACRDHRIDPEVLGREARDGGNPVIPLVRHLTLAVGPPGREWVHWGATSQDILDTAAALISRDAGGIVVRELSALGESLAALADRHRRTVMAGRTLLQPALPITFGLKAAQWMVAIDCCSDHLRRSMGDLVVQLGGATGTLASLGPDGVSVLKAFALELDLGEPVMPWHSSRQRPVVLAGALSLAAGTAAKISGDIALMMQEEVGEAYEPAGLGRGGSSTMPHKRNPVGAAAVGAAARRAHGLAALITGSVVGEHERSLVAWPVEWQTLGQLLALAGGAVARAGEIVAGLEVEPERMSDRVHQLAGDLLAERIALTLAPRLGRTAARDAVSAASGRASSRRAEDLQSALLSDPRVADVIDADELQALLDPAGYLGSTQAWIDRALAAHHSTDAATGRIP